MVFFMITLIISLGFGFYILHLDNKTNNILESCEYNEYESVKNNNMNNSCLISKSDLIKEKKQNNTEFIPDEERKLLHLSKLI